METVLSSSEIKWSNYEDKIRQTVLAWKAVGRTPAQLDDNIMEKWKNINQAFHEFLEFVKDGGYLKVNWKNTPSNWDKEGMYKDNTKALIYVIRNGIIDAMNDVIKKSEDEKKVKEEVKEISMHETYEKYFKNNPKVINFNYTTLLEKNWDVIHVHGLIDKDPKNKKYIKRGEVKIEWSNYFTPSDIIRVGYSGLDINNDNIGKPDEKYINNKWFNEKDTKELLEIFEEYIGNNNYYLNKTANNVNWDKVKDIKTNNGYELIFLGHSLNNIDMKLLDAYLFSHQEESAPSRITVVSRFNNRKEAEDMEQKVEILSKKIKCDNCKIFDNSGNFGTPLHD